MESDNSCRIIMYHYVRDLKKSRYPRVNGLDLDLFTRQLDFLEKNFTVITMERFLSCLLEGGRLPPDAVLLTFDDGYIDHYLNVFPILHNRGLQGSFFVPAATIAEARVLDVNKIHFILASAAPESIISEIFSLLDDYRNDGSLTESNEALKTRLTGESRFDSSDVVFIKSILQHGLKLEIREELTDKLFRKFVAIDEASFSRELYLSREQISLMKKCGMFFGLHGYDHFWLGKLPPRDMRQDIQKALDYFDGVIDKNRWVMNYPYGNYSPGVTEFISSIGCAAGLTTRAAAVFSTDKPLELPRLDTNDFPPKSENYKELSRMGQC